MDTARHAKQGLQGLRSPKTMIYTNAGDSPQCFDRGPKDDLDNWKEQKPARE